jgi:hypothetical protein
MEQEIWSRTETQRLKQRASTGDAFVFGLCPEE